VTEDRVTECPDDNALARLVDGRMPDAERGPIERHLDRCAACSAVVCELAWLVAPPRAAPPRYQLVRAAGQPAAAWEATDSESGRRIALRFAPLPAGERDRAIEAARRAGAVAHANLRAIHDAGDLDGEVYVAEELIAGVTLREWSAVSAEAAVAVWRQAILGVAALHRAGVVHGALSPDHVLVAADGRVVVGGIGGTRVPGASGYVAPERLHGAGPSPAADQFALCAGAWETITGKRPFTGATVGALAVAMTSAPGFPARADPRLAVLARGLAADPARRWPSLDALVAALDHPPARRRRRLVYVVAAGAAAVAAAIAAAAL
jgi:eukaryotic-like serine/threonine-protein kinase